MINRVRLESSAKEQNTVRDELLEGAVLIKHWCGGDWEEEEPTSMQIQTTKSGFWGRLTIRRKV